MMFKNEWKRDGQDVSKQTSLTNSQVQTEPWWAGGWTTDAGLMGWTKLVEVGMDKVIISYLWDQEAASPLQREISSTTDLI